MGVLAMQRNQSADQSTLCVYPCGHVRALFHERKSCQRDEQLLAYRHDGRAVLFWTIEWCMACAWAFWFAFFGTPRLGILMHPILPCARTCRFSLFVLVCNVYGGFKWAQLRVRLRERVAG